MNSKFLFKSFDKKFLSCILTFIFLLTMALPEITSSQENQAGEQNVLRKTSQHWMQVGIKQYQLDLFRDAEQSFRRARIFQKYLTVAERRQLNEYLENVNIAISEGKQAVPSKQAADKSIDPNQPVKTKVKAEKVRESESSTEKGRVQSREGWELTEEAAKVQAQVHAQAQAFSALEEQLKTETEARLKAQQEAQAQAQALAKVEEQLKAEIARRAQIEAEFEDAIAVAKADAKAKAESYAATIKQMEEKLQVQTEEAAKAQAQVQAFS